MLFIVKLMPYRFRLFAYKQTKKKIMYITVYGKEWGIKGDREKEKHHTYSYKCTKDISLKVT